MAGIVIMWQEVASALLVTMEIIVKTVSQLFDDGDVTVTSHVKP